MSIKAKSPPLDPETKARQAEAEKRAEAGRIDATQDALSQDTRTVIRNFGRLARGAGATFSASVPAAGGFAGARGAALLAALRSGGAAR